MKKILISLSTIFILACGSDEENSKGSESNGDDFDRKALLVNVADNIIVPAYEAFLEETINLDTAAKTFLEDPNLTTLTTYRTSWVDAYSAFQTVAAFDIGKAETLSYHNFINVYPVNTQDIENNILEGNFDLASVGEQDEQGFAAIDYMIYGLGNSDTEIIAKYSTDTNASKYKAYLKTLTERIRTLTNTVTQDWKNGFRDTFVNNSGSSATSSFNKLINDYLFHFEKHLRAGKVGIPAGVFSAGTTFPEKTEGFYNKTISKDLFIKSLDAAQNFYNGKHFGSDAQGTSIKTYVTYLNSIKKGADLNSIINQQFDDIRTVAQNLDSNFAAQITTDNKSMLETYNALQKNVITMKVDLLSALSVRVDYVDADGD